VLADVEFRDKNQIAKAIKKGSATSAAEAETTPAVIDLLVRKDRIYGEYQPRLAEIRATNCKIAGNFEENINIKVLI